MVKVTVKCVQHWRFAAEGWRCRFIAFGDLSNTIPTLTTRQLLSHLFDIDALWNELLGNVVVVVVVAVAPLQVK